MDRAAVGEDEKVLMDGVHTCTTMSMLQNRKIHFTSHLIISIFFTKKYQEFLFISQTGGRGAVRTNKTEIQQGLILCSHLYIGQEPARQRALHLPGKQAWMTERGRK